MNSPIARFALAQAALIQFRDFDGKLVYVQKQKLDDAGEPVLDDAGEPVLENDLSKPIGVRMVAPGSKEHRAAEDDVAKVMRKRAESMSAKQRKEDGKPSTILLINTEKAARMLTEFVNFDYQGKGYSLENALAFLNDPQWKFLADQIRNATGDDELFTNKESDN